MENNTDKKILELEKRIIELENQNKGLMESSSIPENFVRALIGRGFLKTSPIGTPPGEWYDNEGFIVATSPNAQAPAIQYLRLDGNESTTYWIPLNTFSELS